MYTLSYDKQDISCVCYDHLVKLASKLLVAWTICDSQGNVCDAKRGVEYPETERFPAD